MWLRAFLMVCLLIDGTYVSPDRFNAFTCLSNNLAEQLVRSQSQSMAGWAEWFRVHATADFRCVHTIVVLVVPQPQAVEDRISFGNQSITVAAFRCQVEFDQRIEAIPAEPAGGLDCGVKLPNNSVPLVITPSPLRSKASHASSVSGAVHDNRSLMPLLSRSKFTPLTVLVRSKPLPETSTRTGDGGQENMQLLSKISAKPLQSLSTPSWHVEQSISPPPKYTGPSNPGPQLQMSSPSILPSQLLSMPSEQFSVAVGLIKLLPSGP